MDAISFEVVDDVFDNVSAGYGYEDLRDVGRNRIESCASPSGENRGLQLRISFATTVQMML